MNLGHFPFLASTLLSRSRRARPRFEKLWPYTYNYNKERKVRAAEQCEREKEIDTREFRRFTRQLEKFHARVYNFKPSFDLSPPIIFLNFYRGILFAAITARDYVTKRQNVLSLKPLFKVNFATTYRSLHTLGRFK